MLIAHAVRRNGYHRRAVSLYGLGQDATTAQCQPLIDAAKAAVASGTWYKEPVVWLLLAAGAGAGFLLGKVL